MAEDLINLVGKVQKVTFRDPGSDFTVLRVLGLNDKLEYSVIGSFDSIEEHQYYTFSGEWQTHKTFGYQLRAKFLSSYIPEDEVSLKAYLSAGFIKGIGEKTSEKIIKHFGKKTLHILKYDPERLEEVPTIGKKKLKVILATLNETLKFQEEELFLSKLGVSKNLSLKIIKQYKKETITIMNENPYKLCRDLRGVGFQTADKLALKNGFPSNSPFRVKSAILYILGQFSENGHCFAYEEQLLEELEKNLSLSSKELEDLAPSCLNDLNSLGILYIDKESDTTSKDRYYLMELYLAEQDIVSFFVNQSEFDTPSDKEKSYIQTKIQKHLENLSEDQKESVLESLFNKYYIVTGGPGVGKTTTANAIISSFIELGKTVALAAPTGRAAQRLSETSGKEAKTIHRLLEWSPHTFGFLKNKDNPIICDVLLLDESSMVDIRLARSLLQALPSKSQVVFIGDVDQLPPIGPGNFLKDLIDSAQINFIYLSKVFRQAKNSKIIEYSHSMNHGLTPQFDNGKASDCKFIEVHNTESIRHTIVKLVTKTLPERTKFDPVKDIQVLSPMNKGNLGTDYLNLEIRSILSGKPHDATAAFRFEKGDKVIQMVNNYDLAVYNGDIGFVLETNVSGGKTIIDFSDRMVEYEETDLKQLKLAYAISIHKSQGSEFPVVILPVCNSHTHMLDRNLLYTGLTRAKKLAILVGSKNAYKKAVSKQNSHKRQTTISDRLAMENIPDGTI